MVKLKNYVEIMIFLYALFIFCAVPQRLIRPGTVIVGKTTCKYTKKLVEWMKTEGRPFTIEYIDNDKELNNYIVDEHKGGIPIVFENGVYQGTGKEYMNKLKENVGQPVVAQPVIGGSPPIPSLVQPLTNQNNFLKPIG
ncbi:hypothetical protein NBO_100g0001 [Nosema bombycis CQ1]|uniref:Glutaredoxin n=1 Tax=Nosema bombycis (strain CQ1 / CVCC 102059) TaxID=578461 RepID=R0KR60_NOSB1|nr:hypothetical protein NBO_100g0001 [Nosema bombycis CQ1]|eukprot:EOB13226.1 hypothetical protein NBO_100g0001 [Nosema bombycis CQ1]